MRGRGRATEAASPAPSVRSPSIGRRGALLLSFLLAATACGAGGSSFEASIEVHLEGDAPLDVTGAAEVTLERGGTEDHAIVFESTEGVVLADIRWTFSTKRGDAVFATAGHGCGPSIDPERDEVQFACTEEYRYLVVEPGTPLVETITLYGGLEGGPVAIGRSVFEQPITWWYSTGDPLDPRGAEGGEVVVTLTYTVRAAA